MEDFIMDMTVEKFQRLVDETWERYCEEDALADMVEKEDE